MWSSLSIHSRTLDPPVCSRCRKATSLQAAPCCCARRSRCSLRMSGSCMPTSCCCPSRSPCKAEGGVPITRTAAAPAYAPRAHRALSSRNSLRVVSGSLLSLCGPWLSGFLTRGTGSGHAFRPCLPSLGLPRHRTSFAALRGSPARGYAGRHRQGGQHGTRTRGTAYPLGTYASVHTHKPTAQLDIL